MMTTMAACWRSSLAIGMGEGGELRQPLVLSRMSEVLYEPRRLTIYRRRYLPVNGALVSGPVPRGSRGRAPLAPDSKLATGE